MPTLVLANTVVGGLSQNKSIQYKIANGTGNEYMSPSLTLMSPKEVVNYLHGDEWNYDSINVRQRDLAANYACSAWSL